jgi:hypothetical protein
MTILEGTNARILGVVINKMRKSAAPYYYGGYFGPSGPNGSGQSPNGGAAPRRWRGSAEAGSGGPELGGKA